MFLPVSSKMGCSRCLFVVCRLLCRSLGVVELRIDTPCLSLIGLSRSDLVSISSAGMSPINLDGKVGSGEP